MSDHQFYEQFCFDLWQFLCAEPETIQQKIVFLDVYPRAISSSFLVLKKKNPVDFLF